MENLDRKKKQGAKDVPENEERTEPAPGADSAPKPSAGKKRSVRRICLLTLAAVLLICCVTSTVYSKTHYRIAFYQEVSGYLTENLRIVLITDLHSREYGAGNARLLADVASLSPDLILLGGDIINRDDADYQPMLELCKKLSELAPVYGVLGNHESERMYPGEGEGDKQLAARFREAGMHLLRNESELVTLGNNTIQLVGVEGTVSGFDRYGAKEALDKMEFRSDMFSVMMAHVPILFTDKLAAYPFDLGVAGHVHGGIIRLPGLGGLYSDEEKFFPDLCRGEYDTSNGGKLIISGGMGDSSWVPRINNTPELVVIDVNWC